MNSRVRIIVPLLLILTLAALGITAAYYYFSESRTPDIIFTIIASDQGFNGSRSMNGAWPIMRVQQGDIVRIHVLNIDPVEAHGFAITHYLSGVTVGPNQSLDLTFTATDLGTFRVFCQIVCFVHGYMQDGQLTVTA